MENLKSSEEKSPKADICLAAYNGEKFIAVQIESILYQTYQNWHLYIRDDGSTDRTPDIIADYKNRYPERITVIRDDTLAFKIPEGLSGKERGFASLTMNFFALLAHASGSYVFFCDQDDVWCPDKLERMIAEAERYNTDEPLLLCHADMVSYGDAGLKKAKELAAGRGPEAVLSVKGADTAFCLINNIYRGCTMCLNHMLVSNMGGMIQGLPCMTGGLYWWQPPLDRFVL